MTLKVEVINVFGRYNVAPVAPHRFGHGAAAADEDIAIALGKLRGTLVARGMSPTTDFVTV